MSHNQYVSIAKILLVSLIFVLLISACGANVQLPLTQVQTKTAPATDTLPPPATATPTSIPPSPTPVPSVAFVNGEMITLAEYQTELARYQAARQQTGLEVDDATDQAVIDNLVNEILLAQGAQEAGYVAGEDQVDAHIANLVSTLGGEQVLTDWIASNGYSEESFRVALARSMASAWMRDQIIAAVPETAEQVHARQILVPTSDEAAQVRAELESGKDFAQLAEAYDPVSGGELGWFPRGYLQQPAVEAAAFDLQPEEYSPVVETPLGFHIILVLEREADRPLEPDARLSLQMKALQEWIDARRQKSEINITMP